MDNCKLSSLLSHEPWKKVTRLPATRIKIAKVFLIYSISLNKVHWGFGFVREYFLLFFDFPLHRNNSQELPNLCEKPLLP